MRYAVPIRKKNQTDERKHQKYIRVKTRKGDVCAGFKIIQKRFIQHLR